MFSTLVILDKFVEKFLSLSVGFAVVIVLFSLCCLLFVYVDVMMLLFGTVFSKHFCVCISVLHSML